MQELQLATKPQAVNSAPRQNRAEQRRLIDDTFGQLLMLLSQKAGHDILMPKVEALHRQIQVLFEK